MRVNFCNTHTMDFTKFLYQDFDFMDVSGTSYSVGACLLAVWAEIHKYKNTIHTVLEKPKIYCHLKNISWNQFTAWFISLVKQLFSRYFWEKMVTAKFRNFHTMQFSMFHFYQSTISDSKLRLLANNVSEYVCKKLLQFSKDCSLFRSSILQLYLQKLSI